MFGAAMIYRFSVAPAKAGAHLSSQLRTVGRLDPRLRGGDEPECPS
jgi:hypothetical protein